MPLKSAASVWIAPSECKSVPFAERLFRKGTVIGDAAEFTLEDIWSFGISGDLPILLMNFADDADQAALRPYIVANRLLRSCGLRSDLVIAYSGTGEYGASPAAKLRSLAAEEGCELMIGIKGGIHLVDIARHSYRQRLALEHMQRRLQYLRRRQ